MKKKSIELWNSCSFSQWCVYLHNSQSKVTVMECCEGDAGGGGGVGSEQFFAMITHMNILKSIHSLVFFLRNENCSLWYILQLHYNPRQHST